MYNFQLRSWCLSEQHESFVCVTTALNICLSIDSDACEEIAHPCFRQAHAGRGPRGPTTTGLGVAVPTEQTRLTHLPRLRVSKHEATTDCNDSLPTTSCYLPSSCSLDTVTASAYASPISL
jgi:hypothetical protein